MAAPKPYSYRADIDALRAFAVTAVIAYHAFPQWLPGGFVGVDVFFVISGYLISGHIFASLDAGEFSIVDFYSKRILRIFPALVLVLVSCLAFGWMALLVDEYYLLGLHVAGGAGSVSNLVLWSESGYFDTAAATKPLLHLWSLGVEEQFYIFWPLLALALWKFRFDSLVPILLLAAASFALNTTYFQIDPATAFYSPMTRIWELLAGAALAQRERSGEPMVHPAIGNLASVLGAALLAASLILIQEGADFPGWWALMPVAGATFIIGAGPQAAVNRAIGVKPLLAIGLISYPLYLWHWPLLSFAHIIEGDIPPRAVRIALVAATVVLAVATYYLVEKPLRFGPYKRVKVAGLVIAMAATGLAGLFIYQQGGLPNRPTIEAMAEANAQFGSSLWQYSKNDTCLGRYPFDESEGYSYWFCMVSDESAPEILLLGSSFANHLYPGIALNPVFAGQTTLSVGACPPMMVPATDQIPPTISPCEDRPWYHQQEFIKDLIKETGSVKLAILDGILTFGPAQPAHIQRVTEWVDFLEAEDVQVVIFTPHIWENGDIKGCFARPFKSAVKSCDILEEQISTVRENFQPIADSIQATNPNVVVFDQNVIFCQQSPCSYVADGKPLIRDDTGHYSEFASITLGHLFAEWARKNAPKILDFKADLSP